MSGRDLRAFVTNHRTDESDKLVRRISDGLHSHKYKHVDYDQLRATANEKKFASHKIRIKMHKFEQIAKQGKENNLLKQHNMIWQKEFLRLNTLRKRLQTECDVHAQQNTEEGSVCAAVFDEFENMSENIHEDFAKFKQGTVDPILVLREDLRFWIHENMKELRLGSPDAVSRHAEVHAAAQYVKNQQAVVMDKLHAEQLTLEKELSTGLLGSLGNTDMMDKQPPFQQGIPEAAYDLPCHDLHLKASVLEEFIVIDEKYNFRLMELDVQHSHVCSSDVTGGWTADNHFIFQVVYEQYPTDLPNRRKLFLDRLHKHLPQVTRMQMLNHEHWWLYYKHYLRRRQALMSDWQRDRQELLTKAKLIFMEAAAAQALAEVKQDHHHKQQLICQALYEQVLDWRDQKLEALQLQIEMDNELHRQIHEEARIVREMEEKKRNLDKEKIHAYNNEKDEVRQREQDWNKKRLEELQIMLAEQAEYDKQRIHYREEQILKKLEEKEVRKLEKEEEEREKERRLELLREQVRVVAESDPQRLVQQTEAWHNHIAGEEDEDMNIQKPLFGIHTFTSNQVTCDPRLRLESKLREAGLIQSDYAKHVLAQMKPINLPRRDTESSLFK